MAQEPSAQGPQGDPYDVDVLALLRSIPVKRLIIGCAAALAALYIADLAFIHLRADRFDTVTVIRFYAESLKGNRVDFQPGDSTDVRCVNALFPHFGSPPCWYLRRHREVRIDM
jgi:hypothetical protein